MDIAARRTGHSGLAAARNACAPLLGVWRIGKEDARACTSFNDEVLAQNRRAIRHVFLSARWALSVTGLRAPGEAGRPVILADVQGQAASLAGNAEIAERGLRRTIEAINALGIAVTVIEGIPEIGWNVPRNLARAEAWGWPLPAPPSAADYANRNRPVATMMQRIRETALFEIIPTASTFCPGDCIVTLGGTPIYVDEDHLSVHGAVELLAPPLETALGRFD